MNWIARLKEQAITVEPIDPDTMLLEMMEELNRHPWPEDLFTRPGVPLEKLRTAENQIDRCHMARDFQGLQLAVATYKNILLDAKAKFCV